MDIICVFADKRIGVIFVNLTMSFIQRFYKINNVLPAENGTLFNLNLFETHLDEKFKDLLINAPIA